MCFFLMIRRPPRSTLDRSSAASDVYKRQVIDVVKKAMAEAGLQGEVSGRPKHLYGIYQKMEKLSLIHISEPTRPY